MGTTNGTPVGTANGTPTGTANGTLRDLPGALLGALLTVLLAALAVARQLARASPTRRALPVPCCDGLTADFIPAGEVDPMTAARTAMDRLQEMVRLHRLGHGPKRIARMLKMSPKTERAYRAAFCAEGLHDGDPESLPELTSLRAAVEKHRPPGELPPQQRSRIEDWRDEVRALLDKAIGPRAIFDRLRLGQPPYEGSYAQIKRLCRSLRQADGPRADDVAIPVVTSPGQVAQVDFGYVGKLRDPRTGERRDAWVFVMVLAHSRRIVARVVFDQRADTWVRLHVEAFEELGGVPATVVPDNLKAAVVCAAFAVSGAPSELHRSYRSLAQHYGFAIDPTPPRDPRKKGKVESGVKYTKHSCFAPLTADERDDFAGVTRHLARWCAEVANSRVHGTTGKVPAEVFAAEERSALKPLPPKRFDPITWRHAKVHQDSHVVFEGRMYSVPWRLIGREVWIAATTATVMVWCDDTRVATHTRRGEGSHETHEAHLPEFRRDLRHRDPAYWTARADAVGPEVGAYVREVFASDRVLSQLRVVQALVMLLERVPGERARAAAARASYFANYRLGEMQRILREGLDRLPLPNAVATTADGTLAPRFARSITELLHAEVSGECH